MMMAALTSSLSGCGCFYLIVALSLPMISVPIQVLSSSFGPKAQAQESVKGSDYVNYSSSSGLRVILSGPHAGRIRPETIPDRDAGCWVNETGRCNWIHNCGSKDFDKCKATTVNDLYTEELTYEIRTRLCQLFQGSCPASVINRLDRLKFDANRDLDEATFKVPEVVDAFHYYHLMIEQEILKMGGFGLFIDIHGHGHPKQRAELGYLPRGKDLNSADPINPDTTSIRSLGHKAHVDFDHLLRGKESFGGILGEYGFDSVPSPKYRGPGNDIYFNGGYNTRRHGSLTNGSFDAIQIESARSHREPAIRSRYAQALACTIKRFYCLYYNQVSDGVSQSKRLASACAANLSEHDECQPDVGLNQGTRIGLDASFRQTTVVIILSVIVLVLNAQRMTG